MQYGLIIRAYAPVDRFGIAFKGDGTKRGPTTSSNVSSRIKAWVVFDPTAGKVGEPNAKSDRSHWMWGGEGAVALPRARVDAVRLGPNWLHFRFCAAGKNPLVPSADIDYRVSMTVSVGRGHLNVNAELTGDQFPNSEVIVQDERGTRRMIQSYETDAHRDIGPFTRLPGAGHSRMNALCICFPVDGSGAFV